jgi:hypothetical protein
MHGRQVGLLRFLVALTRLQGLFVHAKDLFVEAKQAEIASWRLAQDRRRKLRSLSLPEARFQATDDLGFEAAHMIRRFLS